MGGGDRARGAGGLYSTCSAQEAEASGKQREQDVVQRNHYKRSRRSKGGRGRNKWSRGLRDQRMQKEQVTVNNNKCKKNKKRPAVLLLLLPLI